MREAEEAALPGKASLQDPEQLGVEKEPGRERRRGEVRILAPPSRLYLSCPAILMVGGQWGVIARYKARLAGREPDRPGRWRPRLRLSALG